MSGVFDDLAGQAFAIVAGVMGTGAVWRSSNGTETPGMILFKNPTEAVQIGDTERYEYRPNRATAEFYADTFPELKKAVDSGKDEYLIVDGQTYFINEITTKVDGKTMIAHLEPENENPEL